MASLLGNSPLLTEKEGNSIESSIVRWVTCFIITHVYKQNQYTNVLLIDFVYECSCKTIGPLGGGGSSKGTL